MTHSKSETVNAKVFEITKETDVVIMKNIHFEKNEFNFLQMEGFSKRNFTKKEVLLTNLTFENLIYPSDLKLIVLDNYLSTNPNEKVEI